jgi:hypothetical protein
MTTASLTTAQPAPFRALVTGSRTWTDEATIRDSLADLHRQHPAYVYVIVSAPKVTRVS